MRLAGTPDDADIFADHEVLKDAPWVPTNLPATCAPSFTVPPQPPLHATDYNGIKLPEVCIGGDGPFHVFAIGDWGGVRKGSGWVQPADHRSKLFKQYHRPFIIGADERAQQNVRDSMRERAPYSWPDYVLNVGDNFYWGGVNIKCGAPAYKASDATQQWRYIFEDMYTGQGLDGKPWLGVLGNHDYGGYMFTSGWDQVISYTWGTNVPSSTGRWITPAQYYSIKVRYPSFAVDYFFVDNNHNDAFAPDAQPHHNICSREHNPPFGASCGPQGPVSVEDCVSWFKNLWAAEVKWLQAGLAASQTDWQIVVAHFPPEGAWGQDMWQNFGYNYGVDMIIAGHRHKQSFRYLDGNPLAPTAVLVTGGGGGITSENVPDPEGVDDQYGFVDLTLTKEEIMVEMISHKSQIRSTTCVRQRARMAQSPNGFGGHSLCAGRPPRGPPARVPPAGDKSIAVEQDDDAASGDAPAPAPAPYAAGRAWAPVYGRRLEANATAAAAAAEAEPANAKSLYL